MAFSVQMPALGESVTEGTVTRWLKQVGDRIAVDEPLLEVSTDKVDTEIPSPVAGVLVKILAEEDDTVEIGAEIAVIGEEGDEAESGPAPAARAEPTAAEAAPAAPAGASPEQESVAAPSGPVQGTEVVMPELGESVTEGTITRWLKQVGDTVETDEPLLEVSTDKVDTEIPSPTSGTLLEIVAQEDDTVDVGAKLAVIGDAAARSAAPAAAPTPEPAAAPTPEPKPRPAAPVPSAPAASDTPYVTPLVRKLADKHGVDLATVSGSGVGGRIRKQDVLDAAERVPSPAAPATPAAPAVSAAPEGVRPELAELRGTTRKINRIREITARKTRESLRDSAQLTQVHEADMTRIAHLRAENRQSFAAKHGVNLTYLPFYAKAVVEALIWHPNVNASIDEDAKEITYYAKVNLGIAVDTEAGLLSPVIHDAQDLTLPELAKTIVDIADRARTNKLTPNDLMGGTFTITNIGSQGALFDTPILVPPQAAMLGTGAIQSRPVAVTDELGEETIAVRKMSYLPLTYDHRLVDGADAGRFLTTVRQRLEEARFEGDLGL